MAALSRVQIGVKEFGHDVDVSESPKAQLMYYLDSICYVLDIDKTERNIRRLRDYRNHSQLTEDEVDQLLIICILFSPDELINKCIFQDDEMCGNAMNKFYELNAVSNRFLVTDNIIIGGESRHVRKILCFRDLWLHQCYIAPLQHFQTRIRTIAARIDSRRRGLPSRATTGRPTAMGRPEARIQSAPTQRQPVNTSQTNRDSGCAIL